MASNFRAFLALGAVFSVSGAVASTPDGQTPSEETVCDGYTGAAFGLCNAYCEAMDCDTDPNADQQACDTVGAKFTARTGEAPPCEVPVFECSDAKGLTADTQDCGYQPKEGQLACTFGTSEVFYCHLDKWAVVGPSQDSCESAQCKDPVTCSDFGAAEFDRPVNCEGRAEAGQIACDFDDGAIWTCSPNTGVCLPNASCYF